MVQRQIYPDHVAVGEIVEWEGLPLSMVYNKNISFTVVDTNVDEKTLYTTLTLQTKITYSPETKIWVGKRESDNRA
jgi:hypothetical protein